MVIDMRLLVVVVVGLLVVVVLGLLVSELGLLVVCCYHSRKACVRACLRIHACMHACIIHISHAIHRDIYVVVSRTEVPHSGQKTSETPFHTFYWTVCVCACACICACVFIVMHLYLTPTNRIFHKNHCNKMHVHLRMQTKFHIPVHFSTMK